MLKIEQQSRDGRRQRENREAATAAVESTFLALSDDVASTIEGGNAKDRGGGVDDDVSNFDGRVADRISDT